MHLQLRSQKFLDPCPIQARNLTARDVFHYYYFAPKALSQ